MTKTQLFVIDPHPAIPPSDQLKKWEDKWFNEEEHADVLLIQAFQAGADQELEACCEYMQHEDFHGFAKELRAARRPTPKPPSLKEQALAAQQRMWNGGSTHADWQLIRRALEQLDD
jgi:hypothetical protein